MKINKDDVKSVGLSIISNIIFQIILSLIPSFSIIAFLRYMLNSFLSLNSYIFYTILITVFILLEVIAFLIFRKTIKRIVDDKKDENKSPENPEPLKNEYDNLDYYFEDYHKKITVYKNGNGIIIHSFNLVVNDINSISQFKRELNIEDAKISTNIPTLKTMKHARLANRSEEFCFKYKCTNNKDLITSAEEKYWEENSDKEDRISKANPKILKWIFNLNLSCVEVGKPYHIVYMISIPGMFPIENGIFNENVANIKGTQGSFNSSFTAKHKVKSFKYTVAFEGDLLLFQKPSGKISSINGDRNLQFVNDNNIIYDKYIFSAEDLDVGSSININWVFKETRKKGGSNMKANRRHQSMEVERGD